MYALWCGHFLIHGTYAAVFLSLPSRYKPVFLETKDLENDLSLILSWYAEDVTRLVEKEVQEVEEVIRSIYPEAAFIELEPDSKESEMQAVLSMQTSPPVLVSEKLDASYSPSCTNISAQANRR